MKLDKPISFFRKIFDIRWLWRDFCSQRM